MYIKYIHACDKRHNHMKLEETQRNMQDILLCSTGFPVNGMLSMWPTTSLSPRPSARFDLRGREAWAD